MINPGSQDSCPSPQQVLHSHFLSLLGADLARHVLKGLGGGSAILKGHKRGISARGRGIALRKQEKQPHTGHKALRATALARISLI